MAAVDRRTLLRDILPGAAVVTIGVATAGWAIALKVAEALPLAPVQTGAAAIGDLSRRRSRVAAAGFAGGAEAGDVACAAGAASDRPAYRLARAVRPRAWRCP